MGGRPRSLLHHYDPIDELVGGVIEQSLDVAIPPTFDGSEDLLQIVATKIVRPRIPTGVIPRARLIEKLSDPSDARVALVAAAAGYGKTSVLSQWAELDPRPVAWLTLSQTDSDLVRFWSYVVAALSSIVPGLDVEPRLFGPSITDDIMPVVINAISAVSEGVVLVLDDYHEITSPDVDSAVERLIRRMPDGSCLAVASRRSPSLSLARWRAAEVMVELRQTDLSFTEAEARDWLHARGAELSDESIRTSVEVTEGWPAAYALSMGSILSSEEPEAVLVKLRGDNRHIADYISDEVLTGLDHGDRLILRAASLCPEVCGSLLDHMLDNERSAVDLTRLSNSDVLLEPADSNGVWFRLHRLLSEFLLGDFNSEDEMRDLSARAADWFLGHERPREALEMTLLSANSRLAVDMINRSWPAYMLLGQVETIKRDLDRIPTEEASVNATYLVTRAWVHASDGRRRDARELVLQASLHDDGRPLPDGCPSVEAAVELINALYVLQDIENSSASAGRVDGLIDGSSPFRPVADLAVASNALARGELHTARSRFTRVLTAGEPLLRAQAIGWLTIVDVLQDDPESARLRLKDAEPVLADYPRIAKSPTIITARAAVELTAGRPLEAATKLEDCLSGLGSSDPPMRLEILIWLASADAAVGRADRARERIREAQDIARDLGGSAWHSLRLDAIAERLAPQKALVGINPGLTDRELRILQLLTSTHLSQREIGRELNIAFNTVKSHVKSIYVKIGASTREEAAQIAKVRGLL